MKRGRHTPARILPDQGGFTIIETLVGILILVVGVAGMAALIGAANRTTLSTNQHETATNLDRELVEAAQGVTYAQTAPGSIASAVQSRSGLGDASAASGWQIIRRGVTFTVTVSSCTFDDPVDSAGTHSVPADQPYCADGASGGSLDADPSDYRRVTASLAWTSGGRTRNLSQTAIVTSRRASAANTPAAEVVAIASCTPSAGCNATALAGSEIAPCATFQNSPACSASATACGGTCATAVNFTVTTVNNPTSVKWAVDGTVQGNASGSGNSWTFTWNLGSNYPQTPVDGTYAISAQAYDVAGAATGDPAVKSVTLNRFTPDVNAFRSTAGKNPLFSDTPEIEYYSSGSSTARIDRDIVGYTFSRFYPSGASTVYDYAGTCSNITGNWCRDTTFPSAPSWVRYETVPNDRAFNGEVRWAANYVTCTSTGGGAVCSRDVNGANARPTAPSSLTASQSASDVTLSWSVPTSNGGAGDSDSGDCVDTFRIYRTSTSVSTPTITDRYARTPFGVVSAGCGTTASASYTDTNTGGSQHNYWVTSVDTRLAESVLLGPVTQ